MHEYNYVPIVDKLSIGSILQYFHVANYNTLYFMEMHKCTILDVILSYHCQYVYMCVLLPLLHNLNCCTLFLDKPVNSASQVTGVLLSMLSISTVSYLLCYSYNIMEHTRLLKLNLPWSKSFIVA